MKYINKIILKNFQSHKHTVLNFDSGLNIIVGPSDSGKTAILRAVKWVLYNEPLGEYFIREGEENCSVIIEFNTGIKVERYRDKSKNQYNLYIDGEVETFEGFGSMVPLEISEAMGIDKLELDHKEMRRINLAEQLDGPFLVSEKPSIKASSIGRLVGANIIDDALKESLKDNRNLGIRRNNLIEENILLEKELKEFFYLDKLEEQIKTLDNIAGEIKSKTKTLDFLKSQYKKYLEIKSDSKKITDILEKLGKLNNLDNIIVWIDMNLIKYNQLINIDKKMKNSQIDKKNQYVYMEKTKNIDEIKKCIINLEEYIKLYQTYITRNDKLEFIYKNKYDIQLNIEKLRNVDSISIKDLNCYCDKLKKTIDLNIKYKKIENSLKNGKMYIKNFEKLNVVNENVYKITESLTKENILKKLMFSYIDIRQNIDKGSNYIKINNSDILDLLNEYRNILLNEKVCPLCFSELDKKHIDEIIQKYMEEINI